jgi:hypothetical protein
VPELLCDEHPPSDVENVRSEVCTLKSVKGKGKETKRRKTVEGKEVGVLDERRENTSGVGDSPRERNGNQKEKEKRKKGVEDGPAKKRSRVLRPGETVATVKDKKGSVRNRAEKEQLGIEPEPKPKRKRTDKARRKETPSAPTSLPTPTTKVEPTAPTVPNSEISDPTTLNTPADPDLPLPHSELLGLLIESLAVSRASSLPASSLYRLVSQAHPAVCSQRSAEQWLTIFEKVLEDGHAVGVFGKVESSGQVRVSL